LIRIKSIYNEENLQKYYICNTGGKEQIKSVVESPRIEITEKTSNLTENNKQTDEQ